MTRNILIILVVALCSAEELTIESKATQADQFLPSAHKVEPPNLYNLHSNDEKVTSSPVTAQPETATNSNPPATSPVNRQGRFFFPFNNFAGGLTGNPSLSSVLTLNLNNLALVGVFLIGVFILLPSIIGFLTGLTGAPYAARSLRTDEQPSRMQNIMQMLDNILSKNKIDVHVCMERASCHVAKNTLTSRSGSSSALETALNWAITSGYGQNLLTSYRLKDAVDRGKNGADCDSQYSQCPYSLGNLSKLITTYYAGFGGGSSAPPVYNPIPYYMYNSTAAFRG